MTAPAPTGAVNLDDCLPWVSQSWPLWSTTATIVCTRAADLPVARAAMAQVTAAVDKAASRFRPDSELAAVNTAEGRPVEISPLMLDLVRCGLDVARDTGGLIDPTIGGLLVAYGYDRDISDVRLATETAGAPRYARIKAATRPDYRAVRLDEAAGTLQIPSGTILDLGASAKAWASDAAARAAYEATGSPVLAGLGGDLAVAGVPEGSPGFLVEVAERHEPLPQDAPIARIALAVGGLATSTTVVRRWGAGRREVHHLLDPRTARPAREVWRTVTVAGATCVDANAATSAAILLGNEARGWLVRAGLPARLVAADGTVVTVDPWPAPC